MFLRLLAMAAAFFTSKEAFALPPNTLPVPYDHTPADALFGKVSPLDLSRHGDNDKPEGSPIFAKVIARWTGLNGGALQVAFCR